MGTIRYMISDAAKQVDVEAHVLRYWEEELDMKIARNEMGHRYYTNEDILRFQQIHEMKENGYGLKAIKMLLQDENVMKEIPTKSEIVVEDQIHLDRRDEERYQKFDEILRMRQRKKEGCVANRDTAFFIYT